MGFRLCKRFLLSACFSFFVLVKGYTQTNFFQPSDSLNYKRALGLNLVNASIWGGSLFALNRVWYADYPKSKLHTFNDASEWLQMDKFGHAFTAFQVSKSLASLNRWSGMSPVNSVVLASSLAFGYQTSIEFLDGFSSEWGFSWSDVAANAFGSLLYVSQELIFAREVVHFKQSYSPTIYASMRPNTLGSTPMERYLKDYNGQTYWFSVSPKTLLPKVSFPNWLLFSFGYSVDAKLVGLSNIYTSKDQITYLAKREFLFSLDIDLSKFKYKRIWVKNVLRPFSAIKIPFPSLLWKNGVCYGIPFYF